MLLSKRVVRMWRTVNELQSDGPVEFAVTSWWLAVNSWGLLSPNRIGTALSSQLFGPATQVLTDGQLFPHTKVHIACNRLPKTILQPPTVDRHPKLPLSNMQPHVFHRALQQWLSGVGLSKNLSSPAHGNTVVTAVPLAIGENGSKIAYFSHSAGTAHGAPPMAFIAGPAPP